MRSQKESLVDRRSTTITKAREMSRKRMLMKRQHLRVTRIRGVVKTTEVVEEVEAVDAVEVEVAVVTIKLLTRLLKMI